jgi:hypothetical protein
VLGTAQYPAETTVAVGQGRTRLRRGCVHAAVKSESAGYDTSRCGVALSDG